MLRELLTTRYDEIVARARVKVASRRVPQATDEEVQHGVPLFLTQLIAVLRRADGGPPPTTMTDSAALHANELLRMGFTIAQVVHDYGDVCQVVSEMARDSGAQIGSEEYRVFNACLDDAIAEAVTEYERERERAMKQESTEKMGSFVHELRNFLNTAALSSDMLRDGRVSSTGNTAAVLQRSLAGMRHLVDRSLTEVRLEAKVFRPERLLLAEFIEDVEISAAVDAKSRGLRLAVSPVPVGLAAHGDRALLASAVSNLLQNAFKFTHPNSTVTLTVRVEGDRVLVEVQDECGGLPPGKAEELFGPFEQRSPDRSGVGLGLMIARRATEACGGSLAVRNRPGEGCVFSVALPRSLPAAPCA
jgi:signal transduction histidine kinase